MRAGILLSTTVLSAALIGSPARAAPDDDAPPPEEIVITGTKIRGIGANEIASPVEVFSRKDIAERAPGGGKATDFLTTIPQSVGVYRANVSSSLNQIEGNFGGGSVDLRGLGPGATLVLVNGHRQTAFPLAQDGRVDSNSLVPGIAIANVELLLDGASAVYGTDAVAGVANFITRDSFTGLEVKGDLRGSTQDWNTSNYTLSAIGGLAIGERFHATLSGEYFNQEGLSRGERGLVTGAAQAYSSTGFPGNFTVPRRDAAGQLISGTTTRPDPDCASVAAAGITTNAPDLGTDTFFANNRCLQSVKNFRLIPDEERINVRFSLSGDLDDGITLKASGGYGHAATQQYLSQSQSLLAGATIPGENPGNTFRAVNTNGQPLFAMPDPTDPTRPLRNSAGVVILTSDPTNPASGIPFNEDVRVRSRPVSSTNAPDKPYDNITETYRADAQLNAQLSDRFSAEVAVGYSHQRLVQHQPDLFLSAYQSALNGRGGPNGDQYWNPFANALTAAAGSQLANNLAVADSFLVDVRDVYQGSLFTADASISGQLLELPAGWLNVAFGSQFRHNSVDYDFDARRNDGTLGFNGVKDTDFSASEDAKAVFAELQAPLARGDGHSLDLYAAGRYEDNGGKSSFNPKIGLSGRIGPLRLNGSYSTSFLTPSLFQRFGARAAFTTVTDPLNGNVSTQVFTRTIGNPDLEPQDSRSINFGATLEILHGLRAELNYWDISFNNLLTAPTPQAQVNANSPNVIRDATGQINQIDAPFFNAASVNTNGLDMGLTYASGETGIGEFRLFARGAWTRTYEIRLVKGGTVVDGVGDSNTATLGIAIPEWRATGGANWTTGPHSVNVNLRYTSKVKRTAGTAVAYSNPQTIIDLGYSFEWEALKTRLSLGVLNVFKDEANVVSTTTNELYIPNVQDIFPRRVYFTIAKTF